MKYFCVSDIHSFGSILVEALDKAGFDKNNKEHCLVILGDIFDRGEETIKVYDFIQSIPKKQRILVKGNHESLYLKLLNKAYPETYDFNNGTVKTFCHIAGINSSKLNKSYWLINSLALNLSEVERTAYVKNQLCNTWEQVKGAVTKSPVTKFIKSKEWKNYFELSDYVFVHSFVPEGTWYDDKTMQVFFEPKEKYNEKWREADDFQWEEAMWGCPWKQFKQGLFKEDKTLVTGHWHTSDYYGNLDSDFTKLDCPIYNKDGLIGLDACTALTGRINVLKIEQSD